jgi:hypothetical protein
VRRPVVAIHQPNYLPWLGFFAKAAQADVFVLLDDVQFEKGGWTNRVEVKTAAGRTLLTVPVALGHGGIPRVDEVRIADDARWAARHAATLAQSYGRAPGWAALGPRLVEILGAGHARLAVLNARLIEALLAALEVRARVVRSSELGPRDARASAGLVEICRRLGAATYLSGAGGRKYNDPVAFAEAGIDLAYSAFAHPTYAQPHGAFEPGLSAVDLAFSAPDDAASLLRGATETMSA